MTLQDDQIRTELSGLVHQVAAYMGPGWSAPNRSEFPHLYAMDGPDGAQVYLSVAWNAKGKVTCQGGYPRGPERLYDIKNVEISVTASRGPAVIAAEIKRRLLPGYLIELDKAKAEIARDVASRDTQVQTADRIAAALPMLHRRDDGKTITFGYHGSAAVSLRVEVRTGGHVVVDRLSGDADAIVPALVTLMAWVKA